MTHHSYNEFHLGDNLIHLHFLRKLAQRYPDHEFVHAVHPCYIQQLSEAVEDIRNVILTPIDQKPSTSVNVWKNAGATITDGKPGSAGANGVYVSGFWEQHRFRNNYAWFYIDWFNHLARGMGLENPIKEYRDLLFDYPKIANHSEKVKANFYDWPNIDFLVVNSRPCSGQCLAYNDVEYLTPLILELSRRYKYVVCTQPIAGGGVRCTTDYGLTISDIGTLSMHADYLLMVSTGPSWPTFNVWNTKTVKLRLLLLKPDEKVDYAPNMVQVFTREEAREVLVRHGLL